MALVVYQKPVNINKLKSILEATTRQFENQLVPETIVSLID